VSWTNDETSTEVVRLAFRYRQSLRETDPKSLYDAEFTDADGDPDLQLSVYVAALLRLEQLTLEHYAAAGNDPPRRGLGVDVSAICPEPVKDPTDAAFALVRETHHYLAFADAASLLEFAAALLEEVQKNPRRERLVAKAVLRRWLHDHQGESEWRAFLTAANEKWRKFPKA
jgi:hypothetical protein